jgi:hypothetical protein
MRDFFQELNGEQRTDLKEIALAYGKYVWDSDRINTAAFKKSSLAPYHVGLGVKSGDFFDLTKRAVLISDTLLLSHSRSEAFHEVDRQRPPYEMVYGFHCRDPEQLGRWILEAEPLLLAGLAWYLPNYSKVPVLPNSIREGMARRGWQARPGAPQAIDFLIRDGRAVEVSGAQPLKSQLVRPIMRIDLPFIGGVGLRDFGQITVEEFGSYAAFRDFLRLSFLELDDALNDVQSDRALARIGLQIADETRAIKAEMGRVRRKRAVSLSGAALGSVGAVLVAVYGPALQAAIAALGAGGGVWGILHAATENSTRTLRENKWYYVWALGRESDMG